MWRCARSSSGWVSPRPKVRVWVHGSCGAYPSLRMCAVRHVQVWRWPLLPISCDRCTGLAAVRKRPCGQARDRPGPAFVVARCVTSGPAVRPTGDSAGTGGSDTGWWGGRTRTTARGGSELRDERVGPGTAHGSSRYTLNHLLCRPRPSTRSRGSLTSRPPPTSRACCLRPISRPSACST